MRELENIILIGGSKKEKHHIRKLLGNTLVPLKDCWRIDVILRNFQEKKKLDFDPCKKVCVISEDNLDNIKECRGMVKKFGEKGEWGPSLKAILWIPPEELNDKSKKEMDFIINLDDDGNLFKRIIILSKREHRIGKFLIELKNFGAILQESGKISYDALFFVEVFNTKINEKMAKESLIEGILNKKMIYKMKTKYMKCDFCPGTFSHKEAIFITKKECHNPMIGHPKGLTKIINQYSFLDIWNWGDTKQWECCKLGPRASSCDYFCKCGGDYKKDKGCGAGWHAGEGWGEAKIRDSQLKDNVLVIGTTGSGKSTLINMLMKHLIAEEGQDIKSCTKTPQKHSNGKYNFIDTQGFKDMDNSDQSIFKVLLQKLFHKHEFGPWIRIIFWVCLPFRSMNEYKSQAEMIRSLDKSCESRKSVDVSCEIFKRVVLIIREPGSSSNLKERAERPLSAVRKIDKTINPVYITDNDFSKVTGNEMLVVGYKIAHIWEKENEMVLYRKSIGDILEKIIDSRIGYEPINIHKVKCCECGLEIFKNETMFISYKECNHNFK